MNLLSLKNIFRTLLTKKVAKPSGAENMIDLANNQMICTSGVCANSWKPFQMKAKYPESTEQNNQSNRMN
jgi:hypothetical protein